MIIKTSTTSNKNALKITFVRDTDTHQIALDGAKKIRLGVKDGPTKFTLPLILRNIARVAKGIKESSFEVDVDSWYVLAKNLISKEEFAEKLGYEIGNAAYDFEKYKKDITKQTLVLVVKDKALLAHVKRGLIISEELNAARELINMPGSHLTPNDLAVHAATIGNEIAGVKVSLLDSKKMKELSMNAILSVGESSPNKPKFIMMEYTGGKKGDRPILFVGKGVTFDTGGSNLKPGNHMNGMHMDMAGGAIAVHTLTALAKLKVKKNIVALIPAVENRVTGDSYLPGDVIIGMSGQAIEVLNTDAEGRVILSDALTYAKRYDPAVVIDLATLTGSSVAALGQRSSALFSNRDALVETLKEFGEGVKNLMWPMPLYEEYKEDIKGALGGFTNTHNKMERGGDVVLGAMFLHQFAKDYPWAHIDIAPRMESIPGDNLAHGATGEPLYALVKFAETVDISFV